MEIIITLLLSCAGLTGAFFAGYTLAPKAVTNITYQYITQEQRSEQITSSFQGQVVITVMENGFIDQRYYLSIKDITNIKITLSSNSNSLQLITNQK